MHQVKPPMPSVGGSGEVIVLLSLRFKPGSEDDVERQMRPAIEATRAEEGCDGFEFFKVSGRTAEYVVLERWADQAALDRHMERPHTKAVIEMFTRNLAFPMTEMPDHETFLDDLVPTA